MKIEDIIKQGAALRDAVKNLVAEAEAEAPHLVNAAGALHTAVVNLEGYVAAAANAAEAAKKTEAK